MNNGSTKRNRWNSLPKVEIQSLPFGHLFRDINWNLCERGGRYKNRDDGPVFARCITDGVECMYISNALVVPVRWQHEDEMSGISDEEYQLRFADSRVIDGVRMFPLEVVLCRA